MSRITELASIIGEKTAVVAKYFEAHGLPPPSYAIDGPLEIAIPSEETSVGEAHIAVLSATAELHSLLLGPKAMLMSQNRVDSLSLHGIYRFNLDKSFPVGSEVTFETISEQSGLNVVDTRRILRHAMTNGIFYEPRPGVVGHTASSRLMASDPAVRDFVGAGAEEATPAHAKTIDAISHYGYATHPSQSGFSLAHDSSKGFYDELRDDPDRGRRWANGMTLYASTVSTDALLKNFDWASLGPGPVVDVGGGHGPVSISIARQAPTLRFIVQDMEHVVSEGPSHVPSKLKDRISFMPYDIRTPQPVVGAPVYLFRAVLHNWPDASCVEILRNQIPALKTGAKIILGESVMGEPGTLPLYLEKRRRTMDLNMLAYFGSRERTKADWEDLIKGTDERFDVRFPPPLPGEPMRMIEVTWKG